jgi:hypothetical protein
MGSNAFMGSEFMPANMIVLIENSDRVPGCMPALETVCEVLLMRGWAAAEDFN